MNGDDVRVYADEENNIPDIIGKFHKIVVGEDFTQSRTGQHFFVDAAEIREEGYNLSFNLYQEMVYEEVQYDKPADIISRIENLDEERRLLMNELGGMLS